MSQSISLWGATYSDVPAILLPKSTSGTARFDDCSVVTAAASDVAQGKIFVASDGTITTGTASGGGGSFPWYGANTVKDYTKTITINFKNDTTWDNWSASTTEGTILAAPSANDFTYSFDRSQYSICILTRAVTTYSYTASVTKKTIPIANGNCNFYLYHGAPNTYDDHQSGTINSYRSKTIAASTMMYYFTSGGVAGSTSSNVYGAYVSTSELPSITATNNGNTVTLAYKRPSIKARCNNTYFATSRKSGIDSANSNIVITVEVYKTPYANEFLYVEYNNMRLEMNQSPANV